VAHVILKNDWYAPGDFYIARGEAGTVHVIADHLVKHLPSSAKVVDGAGKPLPVVAREPRLSDFDESLRAAEALDYVQKQADTLRAAVDAKRLAALTPPAAAAETIADLAADPVDETPGRRKPRAGA
jgi:hypothetical protein